MTLSSTCVQKCKKEYQLDVWKVLEPMEKKFKKEIDEVLSKKTLPDVMSSIETLLKNAKFKKGIVQILAASQKNVEKKGIKHYKCVTAKCDTVDPEMFKGMLKCVVAFMELMNSSEVTEAFGSFAKSYISTFGKI